MKRPVVIIQRLTLVCTECGCNVEIDPSAKKDDITDCSECGRKYKCFSQWNDWGSMPKHVDKLVEWPLSFKKLDPKAIIPKRQSALASGLDLHARLDAPWLIGVGQLLVVPTGLAVEIPVGWEGQIRPRSGMAAKSGITVLNSPGTVDADYRGEVKVILINFGTQTVTVADGMRIAQLVICPVGYPQPVEAEELEGTARGAAGLGSTGA